MINLFYEKEKAIEFTVDLGNNIQQYAMSFLHIFNNVRDNKDVFYKLENLSGTNKIFVSCNPEYADRVKEYLSQFGEITFEEEINRIVITAEYDSKGYDFLFGDDCEVDFAVDIQ